MALCNCFLRGMTSSYKTSAATPITTLNFAQIITQETHRLSLRRHVDSHRCHWCTIVPEPKIILPPGYEQNTTFGGTLHTAPCWYRTHYRLVVMYSPLVVKSTLPPGVSFNTAPWWYRIHCPLVVKFEDVNEGDKPLSRLCLPRFRFAAARVLRFVLSSASLNLFLVLLLHVSLTNV